MFIYTLYIFCLIHFFIDKKLGKHKILFFFVAKIRNMTTTYLLHYFFYFHMNICRKRRASGTDTGFNEGGRNFKNQYKSKADYDMFNERI